MKRSELQRGLATAGLLAAAGALAAACGGPTNLGTPGSPDRAAIPVQGTVFTIVFENKDEGLIVGSGGAPYFNELARQFSSAAAYISDARPSLPNYIVMTSGATQGIADNSGPEAHPIAGAENLGDQLDAAGVPWRAYMEGMGEPCTTTDVGTYAVKHDPFVYYTSLRNDAARCRERVVDFERNFAADLAADRYRYMWITPDMCNSMHDCSIATGEAWLRRVVPQIMASPGYQRGGAIFILFDEGTAGPLAAQRSQIAAVVISPRLASAGFRSNTSYDHRSYLATVQDIFGLPRLATTQAATPMADFFAAPAPMSSTPAPSTNANNAPTATGSP